MKLEQARPGQGNVETMLAANCVLASSVHRRLLIKISLAGKNQSSLDRVIRATVGIDVNRDGLRTALLTGPAVDVCADVIDSDAVNVADDASGLRVLRCRFRTG